MGAAGTGDHHSGEIVHDDRTFVHLLPYSAGPTQPIAGQELIDAPSLDIAPLGCQPVPTKSDSGAPFAYRAPFDHRRRQRKCAVGRAPRPSTR